MYDYPKDKHYSIQHHVDYRNNQSGHLCVFHSAAKSKVLKYLDEIEERLITEVESAQEKNEEKINSEKHEICQLTSILKDNKQELEFLKNNVDILNFFKLHVNFINSRRHVMNLLFCFLDDCYLFS
jgi:vacuolar-type H+-ATPase subunit I/STV1